MADVQVHVISEKNAGPAFNIAAYFADYLKWEFGLDKVSIKAQNDSRAEFKVNLSENDRALVTPHIMQCGEEKGLKVIDQTNKPQSKKRMFVVERHCKAG